MDRVTQAVVLVGGRGTRLGSLTDSTPKPMLPVAGRPFLEYQLAFLRACGIEEVVFCAGYLAEVLRRHFGGQEWQGMRVRYSVESQPAGTGGAVKLAEPLLRPAFFVLNGDTLFEAPLPRLAEAISRGPGTLGAVALREVEDVARYGAVRLQAGLITEFAEKSANGRGWISGGIYCLRKEALEFLPSGASSLETDLFPALAVAGRLAGVPGEGYFVDIGLPETLAQAQVELPAWLDRLQAGAHRA